MVPQTKELSDGENIANILMENVMNCVIKTIGVRTGKTEDTESEGVKLQNLETDEVLDNVLLKGGSIEKVKELNKAESFNINAHLSEMIFPSLPDLCCSLSTTSNKGEGDYQPNNTIREAAAFYRLGSFVPFQYNRQESSSSMITEISNSDIAEVLQEKIGNLSFDSIHLSDCEADETPKNSTEPEEFLKIPGQVISELDVPQNENKDSFLQQSQKFCQFNNKQYLPLNTTESTSCCTFVSEFCDGECEIDHLDEEKELLSESSDELMNVERDSEEILIPVRRLIQTNPIICSTTQSSMHLSPHCSPLCSTCLEKLSSDSLKDLETTHVVSVDESLKGFSNWEEAVEVQINVTEPVKSDLLNVNDEKDVVQTRQYWSSVGLINEIQIDPTHLGPTDVPGIESIPGIKKVDVKYPKRKKEQQMLDIERVTEDENQPSTSSKGLFTEENINYLSFADKTGKEKKKSKFVSRLASVFSGILRPKKQKNNKL